MQIPLCEPEVRASVDGDAAGVEEAAATTAAAAAGEQAQPAAADSGANDSGNAAGADGAAAAATEGEEDFMSMPAHGTEVRCKRHYPRNTNAVKAHLVTAPLSTS